MTISAIRRSDVMADLFLSLPLMTTCSQELPDFQVELTEPDFTMSENASNLGPALHGLHGRWKIGTIAATFL